MFDCPKGYICRTWSQLFGLQQVLTGLEIPWRWLLRRMPVECHGKWGGLVHCTGDTNGEGVPKCQNHQHGSKWKQLKQQLLVWWDEITYPIGSMYAIYGNIYHQYTPNVSIYTIHGSYGYIHTIENYEIYWVSWTLRTGRELALRRLRRGHGDASLAGCCRRPGLRGSFQGATGAVSARSKGKDPVM